MGYEEIMSMPFLLYQYLMVLDALIEPSGGYIDQLRHGQVLSAIYMASGYVGKNDYDKFTPLALADINGLISGKTQEELIQDRKKENHNKIMSLFDIKENSDGKQ